MQNHNRGKDFGGYLIFPSSGSARIFGLDVCRDSVKIRQEVGYLGGFLTPFHYVSAADIVTNEQIGCSNILILTAASAVAIALSYILYRRRDILI